MTSADLIALIKKHPIGFGCLLLGLVSGVLIYFQTDRILSNQAEYDAKSAEAAKFIANVSVSKNLPEQVTELQGYSKELEGRLMKAGQLALNQQYFYKLEAETEVKLIDVRPNPLPRQNKALLYTGIPYSVTVQGSYPQVMAFLQKLEGGRHFCRVGTAVFTKLGAAGDNAAIMNLSLTLDLLGQP